MAEPVKAAGGVVYRYEDSDSEKSHPVVLLIYRRKKWDLPKGKKEENESKSECAVREVEEEIGSNSPEIIGYLGTTYHEYQRDQTRYGKTTYWYAMQLSDHENLQPQKSEDIEKTEWVPLSEAKKKVEFDNLEKLLNRFEVWIQDYYRD